MHYGNGELEYLHSHVLSIKNSNSFFFLAQDIDVNATQLSDLIFDSSFKLKMLKDAECAVRLCSSFCVCFVCLFVCLSNDARFLRSNRETPSTQNALQDGDTREIQS